MIQESVGRTLRAGFSFSDAGKRWSAFKSIVCDLGKR